MRRSNSSAIFLAALLSAVTAAHANHPVLVEGNCNIPPFNSEPGLPAGTCGDFDGDGLIGVEEDTDQDRVFGSIGAANGAAGANNNGTITIVTSGTFAEVVSITGNITLQAAPGVDANIDAVLQGDPDSGTRQGAPGIIVDAPSNRRVVLRNLTIKNWTDGIRTLGGSHVTIDNCRIENNVNYGINMLGNSHVVVTNSAVAATGFRLNPGTGDFPTTSTPMPGIGIETSDSAKASIAYTTVSGSFAAGISNESSATRAIVLQNVNVFDNHPNMVGVSPFAEDRPRSKM